MFSVKTSLSCISLNARGLRNSVKRKAFFLFCKNKGAHCVLLQETHSKPDDVKFWTSQWGDKVVFSHASAQSAGVAILFNNLPGKILKSKSDSNGHWISVVLNIGDVLFILFNVYGYNSIQLNNKLLAEISNLLFELKRLYPTDNVIMGGDFNMVMDETLDRCPPKFSDSHPNLHFLNFCLDNNVMDVWRAGNPNLRQFSWFKPNGISKSRIDYWLTSPGLTEFIKDISISSAPLTDHCCISLSFCSNKRESRNKGYWKLSSDLLEHSEFCSQIRAMINRAKLDKEHLSFTSKWEYLKHKIREFSIHFSKNLSKARAQLEEELSRELNNLCNKSDMDDETRLKILSLQSKIDNLYIQKAKGAYVRSRARWIEKGEKSNSYFCRLEKRRQEKNAIKSLFVNGNVNNCPKIISSEIFKFYSTLYSSAFSETDCNNFFDRIYTNIPQIDEHFRDLCEADIKIEELDKAIDKLSSGKSPGPDGLTPEFYKFFREDLRDLLFDVFLECFHNNILASTMKQGLITLIPKPGKDARQIDNLRPITLLNCDYKVLAHIFANRLKEGLDQIISESQSGFMKGRSIHNNIRLVLDILDYHEWIEDDGYILFLDFKKAFDTIEHKFIFDSLSKYGFGNNFISLIKMLYKDINSSISLSHGTSQRFNITRGIRQGCPISPFLFILAVEMLTILTINDNSFDKLTVFGRQISISQLADDTTLFLKDKYQVDRAIKLVNLFSNASGLHLNINKCELIAIHNSELDVLCNIPVKTSVKYLGITITKDNNHNIQENFVNKFLKAKSILNSWLQRDISIFGRILLTKMEFLSRFVYPASSLAIPLHLLKEYNSTIFNFIWKNKHHYINKNDLVRSYEEGGLNVIDLEILNNVLKTQWLRSFLNNTNSIWFTISSSVFGKVGGLNFLIKCDFELSKLPLKLSLFHQQVLLCCKLAFSHNFSPHKTCIWNNRFILHRNKSLFYENWFKYNIISLLDMMDNHGDILSYNDFCLKHGFVCHPKEFYTVVNAIPKSMVLFLKGILSHYSVTFSFPSLCLGSYSIRDQKCTNLLLRSVFINRLSPNRLRRHHIFKEFDSKDLKEIRISYLSFPIFPKVKELQFKIMNDIYPSKEFLRSIFNIEENSCQFCESDIETTEHIFFNCIHSKLFWSHLENRMSCVNIQINLINYKQIKFGVFKKDCTQHFLVNNLLCCGKFFIHKCRFLKTPPSFPHFINDLKIITSSLCTLSSNKAITLANFFTEFNDL